MKKEKKETPQEIQLTLINPKTGEIAPREVVLDHAAISIALTNISIPLGFRLSKLTGGDPRFSKDALAWYNDLTEINIQKAGDGHWTFSAKYKNMVLPDDIIATTTATPAPARKKVSGKGKVKAV